ncbi:ribosome maturation protein [Abortiporus biennis]|nr:ribosome maturation protein [Abortiporus biennis]
MVAQKSGQALTKVVYKVSPQSTDEFTIIVHPEEYKKWLEGGDTIPLTEVVDSFAVYFSSQGAQGLLGKPSHQQLDNVFGTHKDIDVVEQILRKGAAQNSTAFQSNAGGTTNLSIGSFSLDTRGKPSNFGTA